MLIHVSTKSADYWAGDIIGEINLHQQWHRQSPFRLKFLVVVFYEVEKH